MSDVRALMFEALRGHHLRATPPFICTCGDPAPLFYGHLVDVLLSLPGIAIVELPQQTDIPAGWNRCTHAWPAGSPYGPVSLWTATAHDPDEIAMPGGDWIPASEARTLAAALLAAANAAEAAS